MSSSCWHAKKGLRKMYRQYTGVTMALRQTWGFLALILASTFTRELCVGSAMAAQSRIDATQTEYPHVESVSFDHRSHRHGVELQEDPFLLLEVPPGVIHRRPGYNLLLPPGIVLVTAFLLASVVFILYRRSRSFQEESGVFEDTSFAGEEVQTTPGIPTDTDAEDSRGQPVETMLRHVILNVRSLINTLKETEVTTDDSQSDAEHSIDVRDVRALGASLLKRLLPFLEASAQALEVVQQSSPVQEKSSRLESILEEMKSEVQRFAADEALMRGIKYEGLASDVSGSAGEQSSVDAEENMEGAKGGAETPEG